MKFVVPYLRVVAGMFAAITLWLAVVEMLNGNFADVLVQLVFTAGLGYLAIGKPLRDWHKRVKAEQAAIAARAEAGHRAFLAGDVRAAMAPPPEPPKAPKVRRGVVVAAGIAAMIVFIGIVGDISDGLDSPSKDNATTTPQSTPRSATTTSSAPYTTSAAATARTASPETVAATSTAPSVPSTQAAASVKTAVMPNVVCMDLQAAQDAIQAAGVFFSTSVDATGQKRAQVWDRNWVVVDQTPAVGTVIGEGDPVLSVLKEDEFSGC